ncbi:phage tail protein [Cellulomonas sp. H30R-01]|uniref:phage tail protein n=1 Tax=Cellulomonas sp. H30R-01 TaxID=2704467 RepID=UPI00138BABC4|nr:tail fiber protein [Cellulomonas sp. H30R-01]QHT57736.1 phage tail protein [Cellulomonas sp. H30R-01]
MADPFVAEIRMFAGNFAPKGWALCNGQILPISQNTALFSLLGTTYGGDGRSTFGLPDLQGRSPVHHGQGPGLQPVALGEELGSSTVTLLESEMPLHGHTVATLPDGTRGTTGNPSGAAWATSRIGRVTEELYGSGPGALTMSPGALAVTGGGQPHDNLPPYLVLTFIIALQGIFPPRG